MDSSPFGDLRRHLTDLAASSRIDADSLVVCSKNVADTIQTASAAAAVTIVGFEPPAEGEESAFYDGIEHIAGRLPRVLIVNSSGGVELEA